MLGNKIGLGIIGSGRIGGLGFAADFTSSPAVPLALALTCGLCLNKI